MSNKISENRRNFKSILRTPPWRIISYSVLLLAVAALLLVIWPGLAANLFSTGAGDQMFMPHGVCYFWVPQLWLMHLTADFLIGASYVVISITLAYLVHRARRDIPFHWVFLAFGLFIIACGATHFMEVWTIWHATYWLSGYVKLVTAAASVATALIFPPLVPKILTLINTVKLSDQRKLQLERAIASLIKEAEERNQAENKLRKKEAQLVEAQRIAHLGSWEFDLIENKITLSDELYRIFRLEPQDYDGTYVRIFE